MHKVGFQLNCNAFVQNWNPESLTRGREEVFIPTPPHKQDQLSHQLPGERTTI